MLLLLVEIGATGAALGAKEDGTASGAEGSSKFGAGAGAMFELGKAGATISV